MGMIVNFFYKNKNGYEIAKHVFVLSGK